MQQAIRQINDAEYNKRLSDIKFSIRRSPYGKYWEVQSLPMCMTFYCSGNRTKAEAVMGFLDSMPLLELDSFLRAKNVIFDKYLDGRE